METFWLLLSLSSLLWYVVVLGYVAIRGAADIREMLKQISAGTSAQDPE